MTDNEKGIRGDFSPLYLSIEPKPFDPAQRGANRAQKYRIEQSQTVFDVNAQLVLPENSENVQERKSSQRLFPENPPFGFHHILHFSFRYQFNPPAAGPCSP